MNLQQIKDIEDYCRDIPKNHVFKKDFVPKEKKPILENMVKDMLKHIIDNNIENTENSKGYGNREIELEIGLNWRKNIQSLESNFQNN